MDVYSLIAVILGVVAITLAFVAYFKTPSNLRNRFPKTIKQDGVDYAAEYTLEEKVRHSLIPFVSFIVLFLLLNNLMIPKLKNDPDYLCEMFLTLYIYQWFGFIFLLPVIIIIISMLTLGKQMIQVYKVKQYPLPSQKVYRTTKVIKGLKAKQYAMFKLSLVVLTIIILFALIAMMVQNWNTILSFSNISDICSSP